MSDEPTTNPIDEEKDEAAAYARLPNWHDADVPDYYADTVNIGMNPYGLSLTVAIRSSNPGAPRPTARIHMSPQMALVLQRLLRRMLANYESQQDVRIAVARSVLRDLHLTDEDMAALDAGQVSDNGDSIDE